MKKLSLTALSLRWVLIGSVVALLGISSVGFYYAYKQMLNYNQDTLTKNAEADNTDQKIQQIESALAYINENRTAIEKSDSIIADGKDYRYQDQIINDIRNIASDSHLVVNKIDFTVNDSGGQPAQPTASTKAAPGAAGTATIPGVTTATATISFSPKPGTQLYYQYVLDFLYKIEQNNTKLHTSNISLSTPKVGSQTVDLQTLTIDVYVKEAKK